MKLTPDIFIARETDLRLSNSVSFWSHYFSLGVELVFVSDKTSDELSYFCLGALEYEV